MFFYLYEKLLKVDSILLMLVRFTAIKTYTQQFFIQLLGKSSPIFFHSTEKDYVTASRIKIVIKYWINQSN